MKQYLIGDTIFTWKEEGYSLEDDLFMENFRLKTTADKADYIFESQAADIEKMAEGELLQKNGLFELYENTKGKFIVYHWARCRFAFGFWLENLEKDGHVTYYFNPKIKDEIPLHAVRFFSCSGIHSKLLMEDAAVFHGSYVAYEKNGILFCGPSGAGKSTQASLWEELENAEIINGDRVLLKKKDDVWQAFGYPCCGSSAVCKNVTLPVKAIVLLEHGEENILTEMTFGEKVKTIIAGTERYLWSEKELDRVCAIAGQIALGVPMFKFSCTPDERAVKVLKRKLEEI